MIPPRFWRPSSHFSTVPVSKKKAFGRRVGTLSIRQSPLSRCRSPSCFHHTLEAASHFYDIALHLTHRSSGQASLGSHKEKLFLIRQISWPRLQNLFFCRNLRELIGACEWSLGLFHSTRLPPACRVGGAPQLKNFAALYASVSPITAWYCCGLAAGSPPELHQKTETAWRRSPSISFVSCLPSRRIAQAPSVSLPAQHSQLLQYPRFEPRARARVENRRNDIPSHFSSAPRGRFRKRSSFRMFGGLSSSLLLMPERFSEASGSGRAVARPPPRTWGLAWITQPVSKE